jgi:hypothetical protein
VIDRAVHRPPSRAPRAALLLVLVPGALLAQASPVTRDDAARLRQKVDAIVSYAAQPSGRGLETRLSEREVNAYLTYDAKEQIPAGLTQPHIAIIGDGRLAGSAVLDLDAVRAARKATSWLDPVSYLAGQLGVNLTGTLSSADGQARFALESATLGGVSIPKFLVQELLSHYSRTAAKPSGLSLDDPFPLPARIRQIEVRRREAVVRQ